MLAALTRLVLQLKFHHRLQLDDFFLIFACICLTASTVLCYANVGDLYWNEELNYNPSLLLYLMQQHVDVAVHINAYQSVYQKLHISSMSCYIYRQVCLLGFLSTLSRSLTSSGHLLADRCRPLRRLFSRLCDLHLCGLFKEEAGSRSALLTLLLSATLTPLI